MFNQRAMAKTEPRSGQEKFVGDEKSAANNAATSVKPSASYSLTLRLKINNVPVCLAKLLPLSAKSAVILVPLILRDLKKITLFAILQ